MGPPPGLQEQCEELPEWPAEVKTAMIRNIACRFMEQDVVEVLDTLGLQGSYDGVRVARKPMMQSNLGYAFVNFCSPEAAKLCRSMCHGRSFGASCTVKVCEVVPARIQGTVIVKPRSRKRDATQRAPPNPVHSTAMQPSATAMQPCSAAMQLYAEDMQSYTTATQPVEYAMHADPMNLSWISL